MKTRLAIANFFFMFPAFLVLVHGLFLRSDTENKLQWAILLSMGVYSALQIGGIWLVSWLPRQYIMTPLAWNLLRLTGAFVYLWDSTFTIILGAGLIGLSQSIFYRYTRDLVKDFFSHSPIEQDHSYSGMAFALNLAAFLLPSLGALLSKYLDVTIIMLISIVFSLLASELIVGIIPKTKFEKSTTKIDADVLEDSQGSPNLKQLLVDLFIVGSFVIPYGAMMALISLRLKNEGFGVEINGYLLSLNALIAMAVLGLKIWTSRLSSMISISIQSLCVLSTLAWGLLILATVLPVLGMICVFAIWSVLEALQIPAIERHIFNNRNYSAIWIDRIFMLDAVGGLIAPSIAAVLVVLPRLF